MSVQIGAGAFEDAAGNEFAGITNTTSWNFTTEDKSAPTLTAFTPANNATNVAVDANLVLTFSEEVQVGTGNIVINQGATSQTIGVTSGAVNVAGNTVTINPSVDFPNSATLTVTVPAGAFQDAAGNEFAGIVATEWSFTTEAPADTEVPTITTYAPADEAANIAVAENLVLTFSEQVVKGTGNITINQGTTSQIIDVITAAVVVNGNQVTINPPVDFPSQTAISVEIAADVFKDVAGNSFAGILTPTTWNFTTEDITAPTLTAYTPANNATEVAVNESLELTFDENVQAGTGNIIINQGETSQTIAVTDAAVTIADNVVSINPADFPNGATITISIPSDIFTDESGNAFAGITAAQWSFDTEAPADTESPTVITYSPTKNITNVALASNLSLTFNEEVVRGTGNITITQGTTTQTIPVNDAAVSIVENVVTINPPAAFPSQTLISVQIAPGAFRDVAGNAFAGIADNTTWSFTTEDKTAPTLTSLTPATNATEIAIDSDLVLSFDEAVKVGTGNIVITQGITSQTITVTGTLVSVNGNTVTINPADFPNNAIITISFPSGVFTDLSGNSFEGVITTQWRFTTEALADTEGPVVSIFSPADDSENVATEANLTITFNEEVIKGTGNITFTQGATSQTIAVTDASVVVNGTEVTINPPDDFPSQAQVSVQIGAGAFKDLAGNNYSGIPNTTTWNFTTEDNTAPALTSFTPANNATEVAVDASLVIGFSEPIKAGSGNIVITQQGITSQTIAVTDALVNISGSTVTINPADFLNDAVITVSIPAGIFTDAAGNEFAGISAANWSFTTIKPADIEAPSVTTYAPADGAENVEVDAVLTVTFNELIEKGTGNITITQGATSQVIPVTDAAVNINGATVTINPPADFPEGAAISVQIGVSAFKDTAGNNFAGITNTTTWNFTTVPPADVTPPAVTTYAPADESVNIAAGTNLVLTFNEAIEKGTGNITIFQGASSQVIPVVSGNVSIAGNVATIDVTTDIPSGASVSVQIEAGVFKDIAGNLYEGIQNTSTWNFSVADTEAPALVSLTPADNATNIAADADLQIVYNEPVVKGTGNITINQGLLLKRFR
ncbi:Ig-like domain-containing protein [Rhodocytophaga rosea]|uniref:Ig-like domain-containing protein n=1 Tax=Rhodocytophaga rosea TaxID=2704465 RepID=A0A6C0GU58_9BACT|nr:Ig-like domain-containing protein [Rhodocytophaga rosea]QHT71576.1 Ig-like domain-containing protein [Rhodocytophaga rosea]